MSPPWKEAATCGANSHMLPAPAIDSRAWLLPPMTLSYFFPLISLLLSHWASRGILAHELQGLAPGTEGSGWAQSIEVGQFQHPAEQQSQLSSSERLVAPTWKSPFITEHLWSVKGTAECADHLPLYAYGALATDPPISSLENLTMMGPRTFLFMPRFGLGNSMRGFCSSFVYSILSGRRLVRLHYGPHRAVLDLLCSAFRCEPEAATPDSGKGEKAFNDFRRRLQPIALDYSMNGRELFESLAAPNPLLWASSPAYFDQFWVRSRTTRTCVFAALNCNSLWCVRSRAINFLLNGGPSQALGEAVEGTVKGQRKGRDEGEELRVAPGTGLKLRFDVAVHVRTRTRTLEKDRLPSDCNSDDHRCRYKARRQDAREGRLQRTYLSPSFLGCIGEFLQSVQAGLIGPSDHRFSKLKGTPTRRHSKAVQVLSTSLKRGHRKGRQLHADAKRISSTAENATGNDSVRLKLLDSSDIKGGSAELNIFLATDNVQMRPEFVKYLSDYGSVFYSSGPVIHTSKQGPEAKMPTMAEFYLMSRSAYILQTEATTSTFALFAAYLGNGTLVSTGGTNSSCEFKFEHTAGL